MESAVCQISDACQSLFAVFVVLELFSDVVRHSQHQCSLYQCFLHSAEIRVKFNYLNYFVGAFFTGFSADVKRRAHYIT